MTSNVERLRVTAGGFIGVNNSNPNAILDVNGNTIIRGSLNVSGSITTIGPATISGSLAIAGYITGSTTAAALKGSGSGVFTVDGTSGRLFSVDDSLSGSLFSVNTAAGLPIIEAFSDNTARIGKYGTKVLYVSQSAIGIGKETSLNGILDISGSTIMTGSLNISGSFNINGTITATTLVVQTVTASTEYSSGSNVFGNSTANTQQFTGSVSMTGSLTLTGNQVITGSITATAGGFDSDLTLKNIVTRDLTQYRIADSVSPIIYTWKDTSKGTLQRFGYGAQELLPLIPEAVYQNGSGSTYAVDYTQVHTVLIDENTKRIQALERELAELKQIINALVSTK
jgi:cytoskeletal protein CcmA (bactofilin family)